MRQFDIVVAIDRDGGIGKGGTLPWRLPGDMAHFKEVTTFVSDTTKRNAVIMGRKTWDSIPPKFRPLKDRFNIVISTNKNLQLPPGVALAASLDDALSLADRNDVAKVFVIGGGAIYEVAMKHAQLAHIELTEVRDSFGCDTFFPRIDQSFKNEGETQGTVHADNGIEYVFKTLQRTKAALLIAFILFVANTFIPAHAADAARGERTFRAMTCSMCHPAGANLLNPAKPLKGPNFAKQFPTDQSIADLIRRGVHGTAMDAFSPQRLPDAQLADIIAYIRSLTPGSSPPGCAMPPASKSGTVGGGTTTKLGEKTGAPSKQGGSHKPAPAAKPNRSYPKLPSTGGSPKSTK